MLFRRVFHWRVIIQNEDDSAALDEMVLQLVFLDDLAFAGLLYGQFHGSQHFVTVLVFPAKLIQDAELVGHIRH